VCRGLGRPPKSIGRDTREAILDAALDVFAEKGFYGASLKELAGRVGIRDSAIYHYFESKEALLDAMMAERTRLRTGYEDALDAPITDVRAMLTRVAKVIIEQLSRPEGQKIHRVYMSDGLRLHSEKRINLLASLVKDRPLKVLMERLAREGWVRPVPPEILILEFLAPLNSLNVIRMLEPNHPFFAKGAAEFIRIHVDHFLLGAGTPPKKRPTRALAKKKRTPR
jgi:AcrR family transcriptional regulator